MGKIAVLLFLIVLTNSCQVFPLFNSDRNQVHEYPWGEPFRGNLNLGAVPTNIRITDNFFLPDWRDRIEDPWEIRGQIRDGRISMDFPDIDFEKANLANLHPIDGVYVLSFHIEWMFDWMALCADVGHNPPRARLFNNPRRNERSEVLILYASDDLDKMTRQGRVLLRTGWNFLTTTLNTDRLPGSDLHSFVISRISQDINDFKRQGYRWHVGPFGGN